MLTKEIAAYIRSDRSWPTKQFSTLCLGKHILLKVFAKALLANPFPQSLQWHYACKIESKASGEVPTEKVDAKTRGEL
jgi:hypothetical protein